MIVTQTMYDLGMAELLMWTINLTPLLLPFVISIINSILFQLIGRLIVGFAVALSIIAECVYVSEISPPVSIHIFLIYVCVCLLQSVPLIILR